MNDDLFGTDERVMDGTKIAFHMDRVYRHCVEGRRIVPIHIDMGITKKCNCKCVYCYGAFQRMTGEIIHPEILKRTMMEAGDIGVKSIAFIGDGEPTLNPGIYDALSTGKTSGLDLAISTNGIILENPFCILTTCKWMRFNVSAGSRESYKKIHTVDKWDDVVANIKKCVALKQKYHFSCDIGLQTVFVPTIMKDEIIELARLAVEWGVDYLQIKQCSLPEGNRSVADVSFDPNEYDDEKTVAALEAAESLGTAQTKIIVKWKIIGAKGKRNYNGCPSLPFIVEISGNGDVYPCGHMFGGKKEFLQYKMGNLHETGLKEIFDSDRYWEIIRLMKREFDVHTMCSGSCRQDRINEWLYNYNSMSDWGKREMYKIFCAQNIKLKGVNFI